MMSMFAWDTLWLGLLSGTLASSLYFAGLAMGMHLALQREKPAALLFISATVRIALLLWAGSWVASYGSAAIISFALGFFMIRLLIVTLVRPDTKSEPVQWS